MSQVGQSGSQTHINMDFFQLTIVTIILVKTKVENNVPHLRSLAGPGLQSNIDVAWHIKKRAL